MKHIPALDGFRGIAVLLVMCTHFNGLFGIVAGAHGVDMFFVLSGFLITSILLSEIDRSGTISLAFFYVRRALRLLPALLLAVVGFGLIDLALGLTKPGNLVIQAMVTALLQYPSNWVRAYDLWSMKEFGHTWSLSIEEQFYLFWPILLLLLGHVRRNLLVVGSALATVIIALQINRYLTVRSGAPEVWITAATQMRVDAIFVGCLAAYLAPHVTLRTSKLLGAAAAIGAIAIVCLIVWRRDYFEWQQPVLVWSSGLIIMHLASTEGLIGKALSTGWLRYTGKISYGLYLYHYPLWFLTVHYYEDALAADTKRLIGLTVLGPISLALAAYSFKYVEQPLLKVRGRFRPRTIQPAMAE